MLYKMVNSIVAIDFFNKRVPVIESDLYSAKLRTEINQTMEQLAGDPGSSTLKPSKRCCCILSVPIKYLNTDC